MANLLWGKVYYHDAFAGYLREEPGDRITFIYDTNYIDAGYPAIAHTLPVQSEPHVSPDGLHPFFDNLVSEGWLEQAQTRLLRKRKVSRFELLLAFGADCIGAVSIIDSDPAKMHEALLNHDDPKELAVLTSRASLSGVQPKLAIIEESGNFRPAKSGELSTHIAKFPSSNHADLMENEYLTTLAFKTILPDDEAVELFFSPVKGLDKPALLVKRFDRKNKKRIHFEEFNQLLAQPSDNKYEGAYTDMARFIQQTKGCLPIQTYLLYRRILTGLLLGNTDMHLKNFAMFHTDSGLRLTPSYDQVAASAYNYNTLALSLAGSQDRPIGGVKARHLVLLGHGFGLSDSAINHIVQNIQHNLEAAEQAINDSAIGSETLKIQLIKLMRKRWNGTFTLIGKTLLKKP